MDWILLLLAPFAPLTIVPLGLSLPGAPVRFRRRVWIAALPLAASFFFEPGVLAGALAIPYFLFTLAVLCETVQTRLLPRGRQPLDEFAIDAAFANLAMGGLWLAISRFGIRAPGLSEALILLTAVHFHYAGFAACLFTGSVGRLLQEFAESRTYRLVAWSVMLGTPLLAVGITLSRWLEVAAAFGLALGIIAVSGLGLVAARRRRRWLPQLGFSVAAASAVLSMSMAGIYAASEFRGLYWLPIPQMAVTHGVASALGFGLTGLLSCVLLKPQPRFPERPDF